MWGNRRFNASAVCIVEAIVRIFCKLVFAVALFNGVSGALGPVGAQGLTGQISGVVTDSGGGVLPGATVAIKNVGTNGTRETVTGADGSFRVPRPARRQVRHYRHGQRVQDLRTEGHRPRVDRARRDCARSRSRSAALGDGDRPVRGRAGADDDGRAVGRSITRDNIEDIALKGRDFAGMLKLLPGVIDTQRARGAGLGQHGRPVDQRQQRRVQLLLRRRDQQGHRFEQRQLRGARRSTRSPKCACRRRTSRPSTAAAPARRSRSSRAAARRTSRGSAAYYKRDDALERQRVLAPAAVRRSGVTAAVRAAALHVRQHRVDARRAGADPRHRASTRGATSCSSSSRRTS